MPARYIDVIPSKSYDCNVWWSLQNQPNSKAKDIENENKRCKGSEKIENVEREREKTISIKYNENSGFVVWEFMWMYCSVAPNADNGFSVYIRVSVFVYVTYVCDAHNMEKASNTRIVCAVTSAMRSDKYRYVCVCVCVIRFQHISGMNYNILCVRFLPLKRIFHAKRHKLFVFSSQFRKVLNDLKVLLKQPKLHVNEIHLPVNWL